MSGKSFVGFLNANGIEKCAYLMSFRKVGCYGQIAKEKKCFAYLMKK